MKRSINNSFRPTLDSLEDRSLMSVTPIPAIQVTASLQYGVLKVNGTFMDDLIVLKQSTGKITVNGVAGYFPVAAISRIEVNGYSGNDIIRLDSEALGGQPISKPATIHGGSGNDFLIGGYGYDKIYGDAGDDILRGSAGNDLLDGEAGRDRAYGGAGNDKIVADLNDVELAGQAGTDSVEFDRVDPAPLVNGDPAALKLALQTGLANQSFSQSKDGGKITVSNFEVKSVSIVDGVSRVSLTAKINYKKSTIFGTVSVTGEVKFSLQPQLSARFVEGNLVSASIRMADIKVQSVNINNVPNWVDNSSTVRDLLKSKLEQQPPINFTNQLKMFLLLGGSLGPTISA